jgi:hypothetical protein
MHRCAPQQVLEGEDLPAVGRRQQGHRDRVVSHLYATRSGREIGQYLLGFGWLVQLRGELCSQIRLGVGAPHSAEHASRPPAGSSLERLLEVRVGRHENQSAELRNAMGSQNGGGMRRCARGP